MTKHLAVFLLTFGFVLGGFADPAESASRHRHHHHDHDHEHKHGKKKPRKQQKKRAAAETPAAPLVHAGHVHSPSHRPNAQHGLETESLFAFISGSDIGEQGEKHVTFFLDGAFGKRDGKFHALTPKLELGFNPTDRLHVALEVWGDYFKVSNVTGLQNQDRLGGGVALEFKALLVKRDPSPIGIALIVAPHYANSEHATGERAVHYALEFKLAADMEIVKDRVIAAINLLYEPERVRAAGETEWEKESMLGVTGGIMVRVAKNVFLGAEAQYYRKYEGLFLETFAGHALYLGPAISIKLNEQATFTAGWAIQVAGGAAGDPAWLDLVNFERMRAKAKLHFHF